MFKGVVMKKLLCGALALALSTVALAQQGELLPLSDASMKEIIVNKDGRLDKLAAHVTVWKQIGEQNAGTMANLLGVDEQEIRNVYKTLHKPISLKVAQARTNYIQQVQEQLTVDEISELLFHIKEYVYEQIFHKKINFLNLLPSKAQTVVKNGLLGGKGGIQSEASKLFDVFKQQYKQFATALPGSNVAGDAAQFGLLVCKGLKGLLEYSIALQPELVVKVSEKTAQLLPLQKPFPAKTTEGTVGVKMEQEAQAKAREKAVEQESWRRRSSGRAGSQTVVNPRGPVRRGSQVVVNPSK
jgi:hypothetical protein